MRKRIILFSLAAATIFGGYVTYKGPQKTPPYIPNARFHMTQWESPTEAMLQTISKLEASLVLPKEAAPFSSYYRFYAVGEHEGERRLIGIYTDETRNSKFYQNLSPRIDKAFFSPKGHLPFIADGGCEVINIFYDLAEPISEFEDLVVSSLYAEPQNQGRIIGYCNGLA